MARHARPREAAIAFALVVSVIVLVAAPELTLPVLAVAQIAVAAACVPAARTALRLRPPVYSAAFVFIALGCFWVGMAALFVWWYARP